MERTAKLWGTRCLLRKDSTHANSVLHIKGGYECSYHYHESKYNLFYVVSGCIQIETEDGKETLSIGQAFTTIPMQKHKFIAVTDSVVIEEMYVEYDENDIIRDTKGGKIKAEDSLLASAKAFKPIIG